MITIDCDDSVVCRMVTRIIERLEIVESHETCVVITDNAGLIRDVKTLLLTDNTTVCAVGRTVVRLPASKKYLTEVITSFLTDNYI